MSRFSIITSTAFGIAVCSIFQVSTLPVLVLGAILLATSVFADSRERSALGVGLLLAAAGAVVDILCSPTIAAAHLGASTTLSAIASKSGDVLGVLSLLAIGFLMSVGSSAGPRKATSRRWVVPDAGARKRWFATVVCWVAVAGALYANLLHAQAVVASLEALAAGFFLFSCWGTVRAVAPARA